MEYLHRVHKHRHAGRGSHDQSRCARRRTYDLDIITRLEHDAVITGTVTNESSIPNADGAFRLPVPHGTFHLGATIGVTESLKSVEHLVTVLEGGVPGEHVLQLRTPDAQITGNLTLSAAWKGISSSTARTRSQSRLRRRTLVLDPILVPQK
jgi:hypothetical protein